MPLAMAMTAVRPLLLLLLPGGDQLQRSWLSYNSAEPHQ